jgi:hypothetical protein
MAKSFYNIERMTEGSRIGEYTGYSNGRLFRIRRGAVEGWKAIEFAPGTNAREAMPGGAWLYGRTLEALSHRLEELDPATERAKAARAKAIASDPKSLGAVISASIKANAK